MGTETYPLKSTIFQVDRFFVKLNNPLMGTETQNPYTATIILRRFKLN